MHKFLHNGKLKGNGTPVIFFLALVILPFCTLTYFMPFFFLFPLPIYSTEPLEGIGEISLPSCKGRQACFYKGIPMSGGT
jgi:hypothetical protein